MRAYLLLSLSALFWAGNVVAGKWAAGVISPVGLTFYRWLVASTLLLVLAFRHISRDGPALWRRAPTLFALGAIGFVGFNFALYSALHHTTALNVTIVQSGLPVVVVLGSWMLWRQPTTPWQMAGVGLTMVGVLLTATQGQPWALLELGLNRGDATMMLGVFCYGAYTLALRYQPAAHPLSVLFALAASAATTSAVFFARDVLLGASPLPSPEGWGLIAYTSIFPSLLSQLFYLRGVAALGANRAGLFVNFVPVFGALLAVALLGETLRSYHVMGLGLVLGGVIVAERFRPKSRPTARD